MKAIYKQHQGFQHIHNYTLNRDNFNMGSGTPGINQRDDTSNKKYNNNKYFQFNDQDSSGRKYLKEKLNLYNDEDDGYWANKDITPSNLINPKQQEEKKNSLDRIALKDNIKHGTSHEEATKYFKPKQSKNKQKLHKSYNKSNSKLKLKGKKASANISTLETKCTTKNNIHSSRQKYNEFHQMNQNELKHYKKLCLDMRKKNDDLTKQLHQCKQQNRKSISQLQRKVDRISEKYIQSKQNVDANKTQKIMESLKAIKGKLSKKPSQKEKQEKKFYDFFVESLGILQPEGESQHKYSYLQIQILWKQILQFLIAHGFKLQNVNKVRTIR